MILVTSCSSSFNLSNPELFAALAVRVSLYSRAVLDMNVSENSIQTTVTWIGLLTDVPNPKKA